MMHGGKSPGTAAMIMTEDAKAEENTAGSPCCAYIKAPCKFYGLQGARVISL